MAGVERGGRTTIARRFVLFSPPSMPPARAIRARRVFDVVLHDDPMRLRSGNGPGNMATRQHMATNLIPNAGGKHSPKARRKAAAGGSRLPQPPNRPISFRRIPWRRRLSGAPRRPFGRDVP
jgi:hypothetical protein